MAKKPANHGKSWEKSDVAQLRKLAKENTPTRVIGLKMGRTEQSVRGAAAREGVSLKPTNQAPYNRREAMNEDLPEQPALFEIEADEDGCVWICSVEGRDDWCQNLGPVDKVAEKLSEWLGSIDWGERD